MRTLAYRLVVAGVLGLASGMAHAVDTITTTGAPDLTSVRSAIKAKDFNTALAELKGMLVTYRHPDVYNLMGFALRKTGERTQAMTFYRKALDFDPAHKGALEYQGELFVELGQTGEARNNLAKLERLCPEGCEELEDLREAIAHAPNASPPGGG